MFKLFDRVKVNTPTTGTGDVTFGAASSNAFQTPAEAGAGDGDTTRYVIVDGTDFEIGIGTIKSSVAAMERTTVKESKIGGIDGTSKINLSGTAVLAITNSAADILVPVNNLADLEDADEAIDNLGGTTVGKALFTAADAAAARAVTGVDKLVPRGHLYGLTLSNNSTDATNDIDIAAGEAADDNGNLMVLPASITKRLDAGWYPGTNEGGIESGGSSADGTHHVFLIQRSDTGVVDTLFSISATSPTMPANYDRKRRIGSIVRASGAIRLFRQYGDIFKLASSVADRNSTSAVSNTLLGLTVPSGIRVIPLLGFAQQQGTAGDAYQQIGDGDGAAVTTLVARTAVANERETSFNNTTITNTSSQIRYTLAVGSGSAASASVSTFGWIDSRAVAT